MKNTVSFTFTLVSFGGCLLKIILFSPLQEMVERPQELFVILSVVVARLKIFTHLHGLSIFNVKIYRTVWLAL